VEENVHLLLIVEDPNAVLVVLVAANAYRALSVLTALLMMDLMM
jgi:hypothetical protein